MSVIMEEANLSLDPYDEVRKLKDLVRKLEFQNQQLLKKQGNAKESPRTSPGKSEELKFTKKTSRGSANGSFSESGGDKTLDEVELINVDDIDLSDEDSWLYSSPGGLTPEQKSVSPYEWLRKDLEDPERRELQLAKHALVDKLDELAILSPSECASQTGNHRVPWSGVKSHYGHCQKSVDSRTFTRPKKKRNSPTYVDEECDSGTVHTDEDLDERDTDISTTGSLDGSLLSSMHSYNDISDVQEIARLQEESLRQCSSVVTPKRSSETDNPRRLSMGSSASSTSESDMTLAFDDKVSCNVTPSHGHHVNLNISNHSSPPGTPRGSNSPLGSSKDKLRRSLPNLLKGYNGVKPLQGKHASDSKLQRPTQCRSSSARPESRIQPPQVPRELSQGYASSSSSGLRQSLSANHHSSPSFSNPAHYPAPLPPVKSNSSLGNPNLQGSRSHLTSSQKSGLPRPSKIPSPRSRSGIPVPSRHHLELKPQYNGDDDSWSDGCY